MKIAICDDEALWREQLAISLESYYHSLDVLIEKFSSGEKLLQSFEKDKYALIFLDIEMKGKDGFQVARQLRAIQPDIAIIILTSHTDLAMEGYEVQAFRFLAKPIIQQKLYAALQAFGEMHDHAGKLAIIENGIQRFINCKDILYIKGENVYLRIVLKDKEYLIRRKLKDIQEELPQNLFCSVHRSYIINLKYVKSFDGSNVMLENGTGIPISKGRKDFFRQQLMRYMKEKR